MRARLVLFLPLTIPGALCLSAACGDDDKPAAAPQTDSGPLVTVDATQDTAVPNDAASPSCAAQSFEWATQSMSTGAQVDVRGLARDAAGNAWITGYATGAAKWGDVVLSSDLKGGVFVVSIDPAGKVRSGRTLMASEIGSAERIELDAQGHAYVMGNFEGTVTLGTTTLTSATSQVFVVKLDTNGDVMWARQSTGTATTIPYGFAVDAQGNAYVTGTYAGSTSFGATAIPDSGNATVVFAAKYAANGDVAWARGWKSQSAAGGTSIAANADGTAVMVGYLSRRIVFDTFVAGASVTSTTASFVTKLDTAGKASWVADLLAENEQSGRAQLNAVATDDAGRVYVAGYAQGAIGLGSALPEIVDAGADAGDASPPVDAGAVARTPIQGAAPNYDMLLAQYDAAGKLSWARHAGAAGVAAAVSDLAVNDTNGVYVLGSKLYGQPSFDGVVPQRTGALFVARYDAQGAMKWVNGNDGANDKPTAGDPRALAVGPAGSGVLMAGSFTRKWTFGATALDGKTVNDIDERTGFVARMCE